MVNRTTRKLIHDKTNKDIEIVFYYSHWNEYSFSCALNLLSAFYFYHWLFNSI